MVAPTERPQDNSAEDGTYKYYLECVAGNTFPTMVTRSRHGNAGEDREYSNDEEDQHDDLQDIDAAALEGLAVYCRAVSLAASHRG